MSKYKCVFSYYGSKSNLARRYSEPKHDLIIEPFAGGAAYALCYYERDVILNDLDPKTFSMWEFLLSPDATNIVESLVPDTVARGERVSEIAEQIGIVDPRLVAIMQSQANMGTQGCEGVHDVITPWGALHWPRFKARLLYWIPKISHWQIYNVSYEELANPVATWFIDPPYNNTAGSRYRKASMDFQKLALWVEARKGQVIVCENEGADWLPFVPFERGANGQNRKGVCPEVVYIR